MHWRLKSSDPGRHARDMERFMGAADYTDFVENLLLPSRNGTWPEFLNRKGRDGETGRKGNPRQLI